MTLALLGFVVGVFLREWIVWPRSPRRDHVPRLLLSGPRSPPVGTVCAFCGEDIGSKAPYRTCRCYRPRVPPPPSTLMPGGERHPLSVVQMPIPGAGVPRSE